MRTLASEVEAFYRAGLEGLLFLEGREGKGRRFGEAALAAWQALGGELEARDRLDLLLRDAAVTHPLAFSPRLVFELASLAEDEHFGAEWAGAPAGLAEGLLRDAKGTSGEADLEATLVTAAKRWQLPAPKITPALEDHVGRVAAASRVVLAGGSAMLTVAVAASGRRELDLAEQVTVVASSAAERQLWGLALLAAPSRQRPRVLAPEKATAARLREVGVKHFDVALVCEDAGAEAQRAVKALFEELGG